MKQDNYFGVSLEDDPDIHVAHPEDSTLKSRFWPEIKSVTRDVIFAALMTVLIVVFVVQPVKVVSTSMMPRLEDSERIFVNKFEYYLSSVRRGDIVVFWYPEDPSQSFIKRVIGLPGETVQSVAGRVQVCQAPGVDCRTLKEPYLAKQRSTGTFGPIPVPAGCYFMMGDNRADSDDSRDWGVLPRSYIIGEAFSTYWPLDRLRLL
jgi:signal peptidase I